MWQAARASQRETVSIKHSQVKHKHRKLTSQADENCSQLKMITIGEIYETTKRANASTVNVKHEGLRQTSQARAILRGATDRGPIHQHKTSGLENPPNGPKRIDMQFEQIPLLTSISAEYRLRQRSRLPQRYTAQQVGHGSVLLLRPNVPPILLPRY
jgi:hypothetical protein